MKNQILIVAFLFFLTGLTAQPPCGFDLAHQNLLATDPGYAQRINEANSSIRRYINAHPELRTPSRTMRTMALYTIPVVVHVMHTGGIIGSTYNPTDVQITGAINYLNQVYAGTYPGMTAPSPGGAAGDIDIQFALAQRTPTCGATNGIDRVDASSIPNYTAFGVNSSNSNGVPDLTLKNFARWNPSDYYNIWVVNKIDGADGTSGQFIAGYAYFAGASASLDGTVMLATQMVSGQSTLPHEIGHALNLYHPFQGSANSSQCPPYTASPTCYSDGDLVCDTDPISNNNVAGVYDFSCRTGNNTCTSGPVKPYSLNTESNFMSYTNCYTLFTNDQKARMQGAMGLPSRASLVSGSNMALVPCGTVINFSQSAASRTESVTGTTTGCRTYIDYTYQMVIGTAPTATATATLTYSGTGIKGLDYDVTTNGNFASPNDVLTFNSGVTTAQSFTVRVYDDENVESAETAIIDFTLNNGGGDAAKGTTSPTLTLTLNDNDQAPVGAATGTLASIGPSYLNNIGTGSCFRSSRIKHRTQYLITKAEMNTAGLNSAANLTSLKFRVLTKNSTKPYSGFTISLGHTASTDLTTGFVSPSFTQVYSQSYTTTTGDNNIAFSTPFSWDGSSNIVVNICFENATADAADDIMEGSVPAAVQYTTYSNYVSGATSGCSLNATNISTGRANMTFGYSTTATLIETAATATSTKHIAIGSNDYLYSNNSKLLMRLGGVNAPLGCVTSSLDAGGTTWVSYQGGERSAKVFAVTPTTNITTTDYTIALYFDNTELGAKTASSLRIAKTTAASAAASTPANSIIVTPTVTTLGSGTTVFTASFTGFSRFFLVDAAVSLPIVLSDFSATVTNEQNTILNWITSSEQDNNRFDVEVSRDGVNFALLGTVASQGNSATAQHYEYLHINPQSGITWYRLKQTDQDGKYTYSKIVFINIEKRLVRSFVYPVPAKDIITINFGALITNGKIEIFSVDTKILKRESVNGLSAKREINISNLPQGVYFIRLWDGSSYELLRFIKE